MSVVAIAAKKPPFPANVLDFDLRANSRQRAGTYSFEGDELTASWHSHSMHQIQYTFDGIAEVESAGRPHRCVIVMSSSSAVPGASRT
jgi:hypothetical protein